MQKMEKRSLKHFDLLITITERDAHIFDFLGNKAPHFVVPVGSDLKEYLTDDANVKVKPKTIYFIGALDWMPNQEGVIWFVSKVWNKILAQCPDTEFHIAGRNAPKDFIHRINRKNVFFHGQVDNAQEFSRNYQIMVSPLLTGSGMRVKIVEAMAMKKPIVATKVAAEGIPAINSKHMFIAYNENEFANYVIQLLNNPNQCIEMGENAFHMVENQFNNPVLVSKLLEFYENMLKNNKS
ncbi:MAG TPA: glycosyltransferase family 4 protein, partial [Salinivirgaceae bacterium]|nr:glycosyltransferase family 4 protein [Salinivirgaceae bacterium]